MVETAALGGRPPVLRVQDLVKRFVIPQSKATVSAVTSASFAIAAGETLALVGESGSGKTTVARCILGLETPTEGIVEFEGEALTHVKPAAARNARRRMQLVFQEPFDSLDPRMQIGAIVDEPLRIRGAGRAQLARRVAEVLDLVGLPSGVAELYPHEISAGLQQRVGIARAIVTEPSLLVLDEPTSALDPRARAQVIQLLQDLQQQLSIAYLFITHDLNTVRHLSHRVAVMYLGQIVEVAETATLFAAQRHPYTRALLSAVLYPDPETRRPRFDLEGEIPSPINLPSGCYLASRCPLAAPACTAEVPPLVDVAPGHQSACIRSAEIATLAGSSDDSTTEPPHEVSQTR